MICAGCGHGVGDHLFGVCQVTIPYAGLDYRCGCEQFEPIQAEALS